jgi:histidinol-phosphate/aromatic aminotransferase/cobyric acid decarboxylase-like protein
MDQERERFFSRLATISGIHPMPSIGGWILIKVAEPRDLARRVCRRLEAGAMTVPRHVPGTVRVPVRDPKANDILFQCLSELYRDRVREREEGEALSHAVV